MPGGGVVAAVLGAQCRAVLDEVGFTKVGKKRSVECRNKNTLGDQRGLGLSHQGAFVNAQQLDTCYGQCQHQHVDDDQNSAKAQHYSTEKR
jgi:hypothetical protein